MHPAIRLYRSLRKKMKSQTDAPPGRTKPVRSLYSVRAWLHEKFCVVDNAVIPVLFALHNKDWRLRIRLKIFPSVCKNGLCIKLCQNQNRMDAEGIPKQ